MASPDLFAIAVVSTVMLVAAAIDGMTFRVPNWLTLPFIGLGWLYGVWAGGGPGLLDSLAGTGVGLGLLLLPYCIGGMGAGDVKLFAGVGAWLGPGLALGAFCVSAVVGGVLAVLLVAFRALRGRNWGVIKEHWLRLQTVIAELLTMRSLGEVSGLAAARKKTALLLPYGIPLAIGTIIYMTLPLLL